MPPPRSGISVSSLSTHGQILTVPDAAIAADLAKPSDVQGYFSPQLAFDLNPAVDMLPNSAQLGFGEIAHRNAWIHLGALQNLLACRLAYAKDIRESDVNPFFPRYVNSCNSSQFLTLSHPCR